MTDIELVFLAARLEGRAYWRDYVSTAYFAMLKAKQTFDASKCSWRRHATLRMRWAIKDEKRQSMAHGRSKKWTNRIPLSRMTVDFSDGGCADADMLQWMVRRVPDREARCLTLIARGLSQREAMQRTGSNSYAIASSKHCVNVDVA